MIPDLREIYSSIYGAYRLMRLDVGGMAFFNLSVAGFWRSFFAAVFVAPMLLIEFEPREPDAPGLASELLRFVLGWILYPLIMVPIAQLLNRTANYAQFIIAAHWMTVLQSAVLLIAYGFAQLLPGDFAAFLTLAVFVVLFAYDVFIARIALAVDGIQAFGVALLGILISLLLSGVFRYLAQPPAMPA